MFEQLEVIGSPSSITQPLPSICDCWISVEVPNSIIKKMGSIKQVILDAGDCTTIQSRISDDIANVIRRTTKAAIDIFGGVPGSEVVNVENPAACTLWGN